MKNPTPIPILVVEDMASLRAHIMETVAEMDPALVVEGAGDGLEALERIQAATKPYRLIITDISMPRMDGEALLNALRERHCPSPVLVLTAHGEDDLIVRCLKRGACDYLIKPVSIDDLQLAVASALQNMPEAASEVRVEFDPEGWFEVSGTSDYSVLFRFRKFLGLLDSFHMPEATANEVKLALEELGRNAIEWGNRSDRRKQVRFACRILPYKIILQVADEGEGFIPEEVPDPTTDPFAHLENRKAAGKRLGGYGIHLVRHIMDKLVYNAKGNVAVAVKYLDRSRAALAESGEHGTIRK